MIASSIINGIEKGEMIKEIEGPWGDKFKIKLIKDPKKAIYFAKRYKRTEPCKICEILHKTAKLIKKDEKKFIELLVIESGKDKELAKHEVEAVIKRMLFCREEINELNEKMKEGRIVNIKRNAKIIREPYGVSLLITPFNYPIGTLTLMLVPSLLAGNATIIKPSIKTPLSTYFLVKKLLEAGVDKKGIQLVIGNSRDVGDALIEGADVIGFTGSSKVGEQIIEKTPLKKHLMELGGKGNALVLNDADLEIAAEEIIKGAFKFSGQRCDAITRVLVGKKNYKRLLKKIKEKVEKIKFANKESSGINPLINKESVKRAEELIEDAIKKGAKLETKKIIRKNIISPIILSGVKENMKIFWEEAFAPILSFILVEEKDMIKIANKNKYGLDSSIFTKNIKKAEEIAKRLEDGSVTINGAPSHGISYFLFGGNKRSGKGRVGINRSIYEFSREKTIVFA